MRVNIRDNLSIYFNLSRNDKNLVINIYNLVSLSLFNVSINLILIRIISNILILESLLRIIIIRTIKSTKVIKKTLVFRY